jgi:hypothetical protein
VLFFGTNHPALYFWTGGGYLRQDWFASAMIGICLIKKGFPGLGGAALAYSTLLRVFPGGFFVAIAFKLAWTLWKERRLDKVGARIVVGAALATAVLVPISGHIAGGMTSSWKGFFENTAKHAGTPLTNHMGLRTVVTFRPQSRQEVAFDGRSDDPFLRCKTLHRATFKKMLPVFLVMVAGFLLLTLRAATRVDRWWLVACLGFGVIPVATELTCYYFSFLTAAAFAWREREEIPIGLLLTSAVTHVLAFTTYYYDVRYTTESVAVVAFVTWAMWRFSRKAPDEAAAAALPEAEAAAEPATAGRGKPRGKRRAA